MWSLSTNHQLETTDKKRTRSIARRVLRGENLVGLPAGADFPTLSGRRLTRPDCSSRARPATPRQFKSSYPPKGLLAEAGHHSAASQLTIEKLMWIMSSSFGMLVAFGLSVGYLLRAERRNRTSSAIHFEGLSHRESILPPLEALFPFPSQQAVVSNAAV